MAYTPPKFRFSLPASGMDGKEVTKQYAERLRGRLAEKASADVTVSEVKDTSGKKYVRWSIYAYHGMLSGCHIEIALNARGTAATVSFNNISRLESPLQKAYGIIMLLAGAGAFLLAVMERDETVLYVGLAVLFVAYLGGLVVIAVAISALRGIFGDTFPQERIESLATALQHVPLG